MELLFLGTGAGVPSPERNVTGIALSLLEERGSIWLFDCGEGTQHQMMRSPLKISRLEHVFITHLHGDHIYGLPGLLTSRAHQGGTAPLTVFGPPGIRTFLETAFQISGSRISYNLDIVDIAEGTVFQDKQFTVTCDKLDHRIDSYGYRIVEHDLPGRLLQEKLVAEGVRPGPVYKQIKQGTQPFDFEGRRIDPKHYVGKGISGRKVAIMGDTRPIAAAVELSRGVDVLVHEATYAADMESLAHQYHHSTSVQAANIAHQAGAKALIMTHISSRYQGEDVQRHVEEARSIFDPAYVAHDLFRFQVNRAKPED